MSKPGYLTVQDVAQRVPTLHVACTRCDRRGAYETQTLLDRYGPGFPIPQWLREVSADCPRRLDASPSIYDICGVHCAGLAAALDRRIPEPEA